MLGDQPNAARKVAENTEAGENIGAPVRATDADSGQKLTYTLTGIDADVFAIDWATGQIMTKDELDAGGKPRHRLHRHGQGHRPRRAIPRQTLLSRLRAPRSQ